MTGRCDTGIRTLPVPRSAADNRGTAAGFDRAGVTRLMYAPRCRAGHAMSAFRRAGLFALYQVTLAFGIVLMPVALLVRRAGVALPVGRLVESIGGAYDEERGR